MKALRPWAGSVLLLLLAVAWTAPATLLDRALDARTAGHLRLTEAQGTVWSGQGRIEIRDTAAAAVLTRELHWNLDKSQLLLARLAWHLAFAGDAPLSTVTAGRSRIAISALDLDLPAAAVAQLVPAAAGYGLGGRLQLHVDTLAFGQNVIEGSATLQWHAASTALSPVSPLGSYALRFEGAGAGIGISLHTLQGPLQLDGAGTLAGGKRPVFSAVAQVSAGERDVLAPFLRLFAVENPDGSFALQFN